MKKINVKTIVTRKLMAFILALAMVMTSTATSGAFVPEVAEAATTSTTTGLVCKSGNQTLSVNHGLATLYVADVDLSYQFGTIGGTYDAAFDQASGKIVFMLWDEGMLFAYCYELMSNTSNPILWDSSVAQLTTVGSGESRRVTGYDNASGHHNLPTFEQFKTKLSGGTVDNKPSNPGSDNNGNNNGNNNSSNNGNNQNPTNPGNTNTVTDVTSVTSNGVTVKETTTKTYTLYTGKEMVSAGKDASGSVVWAIAKDGTVYYWICGSSNYNMQQYGTGFTSLVKDSNGNVTGFYDSTGKYVSVPTKATLTTPTQTTSSYNSSLEGTIANLMVQDGQAYQKIKIADGKISQVGHDNSGTIYIFYTKTLKCWNYQLQKGESTKKLVTVSSNCTGLAYAGPNSNLVVGYYEGGVLKPLWSLDQIRVGISNIAAPYNKYDHVRRNGVNRYLQDSNNKNIVKATRKNNKVYYNGEKIATGKKTNKIQSVGFIKGGKGVATFRCKKGQCYIINTNGKWKLWRSDVKSYHYTKTGFIDKVKTKSGKYVKIPTSTTSLKGTITTQPTIIYLDFFYKSAA